MVKYRIIRFVSIIAVVIIGNTLAINVSSLLIFEHFTNPSSFSIDQNYDSVFDLLNIDLLRIYIAYILIDICYLVNSIFCIKALNYFLKNKSIKYQPKNIKKQIIEKRGLASRIKVFFVFLTCLSFSLLTIDILIVFIKSATIVTMFFTENMYEIGKIYTLSIDLLLIRTSILFLLLIIIPIIMHLYMKNKAMERWNQERTTPHQY